MKFDLHIIPSSGHLKPDYASRLTLKPTDNFELNVIPGVAADIRLPHDNVFGFIYDNEVFEEKLAGAIPEFMKYPNVWDVLVLYKKVVKSYQRQYFEMPRIFQPHITMSDGALVPKNEDNLKYVYVLDGWVLEDGNR